jgi:hypothetical protein
VTRFQPVLYAAGWTGGRFQLPEHGRRPFDAGAWTRRRAKRFLAAYNLE